MIYDVGLAVLNPRNLSQKKSVGKWVGTAQLDAKSNTYDLGQGQNSPLRMAVDTVGAAQGFTDNFGGKVIGKQGRTAQAMRTILSAVSSKIKKRTVLEIIE